MKVKKIASPNTLLSEVYRLYEEWEEPKHMWFRGEPSDSATPLTPKLFRYPENERRENYRLQEFRRRSPAIISGKIPDTPETDKWLFLAQHYGLSTRLLDWTDNLFTAIYFAFEEKKPAIYVLDPIALNTLIRNEITDYEFPLTWTNNSIFTLNIRSAWEDNRYEPTIVPVAIKPTLTEQRQMLQSSCFTIFGSVENGFFGRTEVNRVAKILLPSKDTKTYMKLDKYFKRIGFRSVSQFGDLASLTKDIEDECRSFQ